MEHEASVNNWSQEEVFDHTLSHMEFLTESSKNNLLELSQWTDLKRRLLQDFSFEPTFTDKVHLLKSMCKAPVEKYRHYLIRVKHLASQILPPCQCFLNSSGSKSAAELERLLFCAGLDNFDAHDMDYSISSLETIVDILGAAEEDVKDEKLIADGAEEDIDIEMDIKVEEAVAEESDADYVPDDNYDEDPIGPDDNIAADQKNVDTSVLDEVNSNTKCKVRKGSSIYSCEHCSETFVNKKVLKKHVRNVHTHPESDRKEHVCQICNEVKYSYTGLRKHQFLEHGGKRVKCGACGLLLRNSQMLERHERSTHGTSDAYKEIEGRIATGEVVIDKEPKQSEPLSPLEPPIDYTSDPPVYTCLFCPSTARGQFKYTEHCRLEHGGMQYKCDLCDYASNCSTTVFEHRFKVHNCAWGKRTAFYCKVGGDCEFRTLLLTKLLRHIRVCHDKSERKKCHMCPAELSSSEGLRNHINYMHMGKREMGDFMCDQCDYRGARTSLELTKHMESHLPMEERKKFICEECGGGYVSMVLLRMHVKRVHKGEKPHECTHCQRRFCRKGQLTNHIRTVHQLDKKYPCPHCDKGLGNPAALDRHITTAHTNIRYWRCKICDTFFTRAENLANHIGVKHLGFSTLEARELENRRICRNHEAFEFLGKPNSKDKKVDKMKKPADEER